MSYHILGLRLNSLLKMEEGVLDFKDGDGFKEKNLKLEFLFSWTGSER